MCTYVTNKKLDDQTNTCFGQNIREETQEKISLMEMISRNKGRKGLQDYCSVRTEVQKNTRKAVKDQEMNIASHNSKTFLKYINIPNLFIYLFIDEKTVIKTKNIFEKAEVLGKFFSSVFDEKPTGLGCLGKRKGLI